LTRPPPCIDDTKPCFIDEQQPSASTRLAARSVLDLWKSSAGGRTCLDGGHRAPDVTEPLIRLPHPRRKVLLGYAKVLGAPWHAGESDAEYVHRVFEVEETWTPDEGGN
jgi:hypothetical protein